MTEHCLLIGCGIVAMIFGLLWYFADEDWLERFRDQRWR